MKMVLAKLIFKNVLRRQNLFSSSSLRQGQVLTHIKQNDDNAFVPTMVDISEKIPTQRTARATGKVLLPSSVAKELQLDFVTTKEIVGKKGPVFSTAIVAGVMAVKKTSELIPFCHPIPIEKCEIKINVKPVQLRSSPYGYEIIIDCTVSTFGKTGIEMEAIAGVTGAALCVYDMLKAVSHDILITDIQLESKTGGKSEVARTNNN